MSRPTATITPRGKSFLATIHHNKKRKRASFKTRESAELWVATILSLPDALAVSSGYDGTMGSLLESAWDEHFSRLKDINGHKSLNIRLKDELGSLPVTELTPPFIHNLAEGWLANGVANSTINRRLSHLHTTLKLGVRKGLIKDVPQFPWRTEDRQKRTDIPQEDVTEMVSYFETCKNPEMALLVTLMVYSGLRVTEALTLQRSQINATTGTITIDSGKHRTSPGASIPIPDWLVHALLQWESGDYVFAGLSPSTFRVRWAGMRESTGFTYVPHELRHTYCTRLVRGGVPLATVQKLARHRSISTTMRYAHHAPDAKETVLEVLQDYDRLPAN